MPKDDRGSAPRGFPPDGEPLPFARARSMPGTATSMRTIASLKNARKHMLDIGSRTVLLHDGRSSHSAVVMPHPAACFGGHTAARCRYTCYGSFLVQAQPYPCSRCTARRADGIRTAKLHVCLSSGLASLHRRATKRSILGWSKAATTTNNCRLQVAAHVGARAGARIPAGLIWSTATAPLNHRNT
jgi:hypothetical protein